VLFGFEHDSNVIVGAAFAQIENRFPDHRGQGQQFIAAPSERNVSETHLLNRLTQARFPVQRCDVTRSDSLYLNLRTAGQVPREIRSARIGIVGCGAVGGSLALRLAQSGVRRITLVDNDVFNIENVGRHELSASYIGQYKANALQAEILGRFCDYDVKAVPKTWQAAFEEDRAVLDDCDLLIAATGDWLSNAHLNAVASELELPVLFCWLERFALAGHGVFVVPGKACLQCINDEFGAFDFQVSRIGGELPTDPSCGAHYQPFSAYASNQATSMMTKLALDAIEGRVQNSHLRTWVAPYDEFDRVNAGIDEGWHSALLADGGFERVFRRELSVRKTCPRHCGN
jgi:molybdopterin/thiamine biosynthesis adenylyltransferase